MGRQQAGDSEELVCSSSLKARRLRTQQESSYSESEVWKRLMSHLQTDRRSPSYSWEGQPFHPIQAFSRLVEAHPHWGRPSAIFSPPIQMWISPSNSLTDTLRRMFDQWLGILWLSQADTQNYASPHWRTELSVAVRPMTWSLAPLDLVMPHLLTQVFSVTRSNKSPTPSEGGGNPLPSNVSKSLHNSDEAGKSERAEQMSTVQNTPTTHMKVWLLVPVCVLPRLVSMA